MVSLIVALVLQLVSLRLVVSQSLVDSEANCSIADEAQNASVTLTWKLFGGDVNYTRVLHSSEALVSATSSLSDRLLILGGIEYESAQPVVSSPVLVYNVDTNTFLKPQDQIQSAVSAAYQSELETVFISPASRAEHASFLNQNGAVFIFGGRSREFVNDMWRGCVDSSSSNILWDELATATDTVTVASTPVPRIGHSFTKVFENNTMLGALVFGGLSEDYVELSGLHLAFISKSSSVACTDRRPQLSWRMLKAESLADLVPTARAYHAAMTPTKIFTATKLACVIVHGGKSTLEGVIFNELWRLCPPSVLPSVPVERMTYTWELLKEIGTTPGARYGASITFVDEGKLAFAGGSYTFPSDFLSDTWELNVNATQWVRLSFSQDYTPPRRGHTLSFFSSATRLFLFGGRDRYTVVQERLQAAYYGAPFCAVGLKITFCPSTNKYVCIACPAGSYLESGSRKCSLCPRGTFASVGSAECTKCPAGTFSTEIGKDSSAPCTSCPAGTYSPAVGAVSSATCSACTAGTFTSAPGSVSCSSCAAGTFSLANASTCSACPRGKWSGVGAGSCTNCAAGTYTPSTGSTTCYNCPKGYFSDAGAVTCSACPVNTYSSIVAASNCQSCPSYAFTNSTGQNECGSCPSGSSWTGSSCQLCGKGYYASSTTTGACVPCPKGSFASDTGSSECQNCPTGKFTSSTGATMSSDCKLCASGSFLNGASCQPCGAATYPEPSGFCSACSPGSYNGGTTSVTDTSLGCASCPSMTYSSNLGATACSACADNTYSMEAWRNCISCSSSPGCVTGRNGLLCSGNGACVYGGCSCNDGWVGGDCSVPVNDTVTAAPAVLYFPDAPFQLVSATVSTIQVSVARNGYLKSHVQAVLAWSSNDFSSSPSSLPKTLDFAAEESLHTVKISISKLSPKTGCRVFTLSLKDITGTSTSAVSSDSDSTLIVYVDDMNGVAGGVSGRSVASTYERQANGTAVAAVTLDRVVSTQVTLSPQTTNLGVSLRDQPLNLLLAIDFSPSWIAAFIELLPAIVAQLQTVYRIIPDGVRLGLVNGTTSMFYPDLEDFFGASHAVKPGNAPVDWNWVTEALLASSSSWPSTDRRHLLILADDTLVAGGSVTLPSKLLSQLSSQNVFAFTLSPAQITFTNGNDIMKSVAFGMTPAIPSTLRQAFEQKDSVLPASVNILSDPAGITSSVQVMGLSSGSSSLPVVRVSMGTFPTLAQLKSTPSLTISIGMPGGPQLSIAVNKPGPACFQPTQTIPINSLPLSGWADAWYLSTLSDVKRLWKSSLNSLTLKKTTSLLRTFTSTSLSVYDSASTQLSLVRTYPGSFFAAGLSLVSRGYWRTSSDTGAAACNIQVTMTGTNTSLVTTSTVPFASVVAPGEWNYGYLQTIIRWELSSLAVALKCNTSSPGVIVEWAALGLLPDPSFACTCPRGFYHDTLLDSNDGEEACVRCAAGSYCVAGIKRRCPAGTFSFGKSASCETCRDGWICAEGQARLCDPGTYSTPSFTCDICPSGYSCRNGKKSVCPAGTFSHAQARQCQICPPGTISRSDGSSTCELCPLGWTSNYQRNHCISCPPGEATLYAGQHPCSSCAISAFPIRNQPEVCLA